MKKKQPSFALKTTTRNLKKQMEVLSYLGFIPVLSLQKKTMDNKGNLVLMAYRESAFAYDTCWTSSIHTSSGQDFKTVASKKTLYNFAKKYGFEPEYVVINGMLP